MPLMSRAIRAQSTLPPQKEGSKTDTTFADDQRGDSVRALCAGALPRDIRENQDR